MHQFLTLVEVAEKLGLQVQETRKLLTRSGITGRLVQGIEMFPRAEVIHWLEQILGEVSQKRLSEIDRASGSRTGLSPRSHIVAPLLRSNLVCTCLAANTRPSLLRKLASLAVSTGKVYDEQHLYDLLEERERLCSTALTTGVAIPHPRCPHDLYVEDEVLLLARTAHPIPFGAERGSLTWLFFLIVCGDPGMHLQILARLSMLLRNPSMTEAVREAESEEDILRAVEDCETEMLCSVAREPDRASGRSGGR
ncbi:PTS sugar transporter subunit IIA [Candidatus Fermentibacterales bacterium]|nr:PTS sugar transporter subunit IIA [Candidatus Fermentibacterales bacterium]